MDGVDRLQQRTDVTAVDTRTRALALWPGLDRRKLARTCGEPARVARLVERRTALSRESIIAILQGRPQATDLDRQASGRGRPRPRRA